MIYDVRAWRDHFIRFEGQTRSFYLDGEGVCTIGIGCQIFDPLSLPLLRKSDNHPALRAEIFSDYNMIKAMPPGHLPEYYDACCQLYLPEVEIAALFEERLDRFIRDVELKILPLKGLPEPAALVVVDMAFNLGIGGLVSKFPKFLTACRAQDWKTAAAESRREGIQPARNDWAAATLESLGSG